MKCRKMVYLLTLTLVLMVGGIILGEANVSAQGKFTAWQKKVLSLVNKERTSRGLKKLKLDTKLCKAAKCRSKEIVNFFDHYRPDGTECFTVLEEYGISYRACAENIAAGQSSPKAVVSGWMHSSGHRKNILTGRYRKLGIACTKVGDAYRYYWVQLFTN